MELYSLENYLQLYCGGNKSNFSRVFNILPQQTNRYFNESKRDMKVIVKADKHQLVSVFREADI